MSQVGEFFTANIVPIYFVYGLAFFVLGLVMALQARTPARLHPLNYIWLLSVFGLLHGLSEWIELATILGMLDPVPVANLDLGLKALSFVFLLQFGGELLRVWRPGLNWLRALGPAIFLAWLLFILAAPLGGPVGSPAWLDLFDVTARYAIAFPGAALACYALLIAAAGWRGSGQGRVRTYLRGAAIAFAAYAVLAGVVVPAAPFFPATALNGDTFLALFGVPVQVGRTLSALAIAGFLAEVFVIEAGRAQARTVHLLAALNDGLRAIISEVGVADTLDMVVARAQALMETDTSFLATPSPDKRTVEVVATAGVRTEALRGLRLSLGPDLEGAHVQRGQAVIVDNCLRAPGLFHGPANVMRAEGLVSGIVAPLLKSGTLVGVLHVFNRRPTRFGQADARLLATFAGQAAIAIDRARLIFDIETARSHLSAVVETMPAGVVVIDSHGSPIMNRAAASMLGLAREDIGHDLPAGYEVFRAGGGTYPLEDLLLVRSLRLGESCAGEEIIVRRRDEASAHLLVNSAPLVDAAGCITGAVAAFLDITPIKHLERMREEFISVVAHDLRNPIAVIAGYAALLERMPTERHSTPQEQRAVASIHTSAQRLGRMVADLLDASRIEACRLALDPECVDLARLVREVVERTAASTAGHPVQLVVPEALPMVWADPGRVEQILANLLSNAAKYSFPDTEVTVDLAPAAGEVLVAVVNRGAGISPEERERLFTRFHRTRAAKEEKVPGLGLGLYITKGLVEAHGGRIWVESKPDERTTFRFTLPTAPPGEPRWGQSN